MQKVTFAINIIIQLSRIILTGQHALINEFFSWARSNIHLICNWVIYRTKTLGYSLIAIYIRTFFLCCQFPDCFQLFILDSPVYCQKCRKHAQKIMH